MKKYLAIITAMLFFGSIAVSAQNTWEQTIPLCDTCPPPLQGHTMVSFINKIYMFGGRNNSKAFFNHISVYDTQQQWVYEEPSNSPPPARHNHKAINRDNNKMYIFFGQGATQKLDDVWYYNITTKTWHELTPSSPKPVARTEFSATVKGDKVWIFGGRDENGNILNDLWAFNLASNSWEAYPAYNGSGLYGHVAGADDLRVLFFGGYNNLGLQGDMIAYNIGNGTWSAVTPGGSTPPPAANSIFIPFFGGISYVFSGITATGITGNCYQWDMATNTFSLYATGPALEFSAGAYLDYSGDIPGKETYYEIFVVFGGFNGTDITDSTWTYTSDIEIPVGLNEIEPANISIYPNPTTDFITISINKNDWHRKDLKYKLCDVYGRIIQTAAIASPCETVDISSEAAGMYILKITDNQKILSIHNISKL